MRGFAKVLLVYLFPTVLCTLLTPCLTHLGFAHNIFQTMLVNLLPKIHIAQWETTNLSSPLANSAIHILFKLSMDYNRKSSIWKKALTLCLSSKISTHNFADRSAEDGTTSPETSSEIDGTRTQPENRWYTFAPRRNTIRFESMGRTMHLVKTIRWGHLLL